MAAPHVAGLASLIKGMRPGYTQAQVLSLLQSTARSFPAGSSCNTSNCGAGIIDAYQALRMLDITFTDFIYLPIVTNAEPPAPSGPTPGFWESATGDEFYVTTDRSFIDNFAIYINVSECGNYKITHLPTEPITNDQFSFSGSFYASGTFNSETSASGSDGLSDFDIPGCGLVSGGPWSWSATWKNGSQPTFLPAELVKSEAVKSTTEMGKSVTVEIIPNE
ncbi:MAG: hypothetical protein GWP17_01880, partial [Aquificales bacterium]|nr:hypothetical protein [Aquificales bacterium]